MKLRNGILAIILTITAFIIMYVSLEDINSLIVGWILGMVYYNTLIWTNSLGLSSE